MWWRKRHTDQWDRTENPEIDQHKYAQLSFYKEAKIMEEDSLFNKWCWRNWTSRESTGKKIYIYVCIYVYMYIYIYIYIYSSHKSLCKNGFKWMVDLKCKTCRINTRENLSKLDLLTKARSVRRKTDKLDFKT